jgi:hypothetical protein
MLLDVILLLVFEKSFEDVVAFRVLSHEEVDHCYVVPEQKLIEIVLAAEDLLLEVLDEKRVVFLDIEMENDQPFLEIRGEISIVKAIVILYYLLVED